MSVRSGEQQIRILGAMDFLSSLPLWLSRWEHPADDLELSDLIKSHDVEGTFRRANWLMTESTGSTTLHDTDLCHALLGTLGLLVGDIYPLT